MPYTEIRPIKETLGKAVDYISNPTKTDNKRYVRAVNCNANTAEMQFSFTRKYHGTNNKVLGFHIIQSFKPNRKGKRHFSY